MVEQSEQPRELLVGSLRLLGSDDALARRTTIQYI